MKTVFLAFAMLIWGTAVSASGFRVPLDYKFEKPEDYAKYQKQILECIEWLTSTPIDEQIEERTRANTFIKQWVNGCPYVKVQLNPEIVEFATENPDLLVIFISGWARYVLESGNNNSPLEANMAALICTMDYYLENMYRMSKVKSLEKYMKLWDKQKLREYVESKV